MFRRRSSGKKLGSSKTSITLDTREEEEEDGGEEEARDPMEVLASLLVPPVLPEVNLKSSLVDKPEEVAMDFLPRLAAL